MKTIEHNLSEIKERLFFAHTMAKKAGEIALSYFRKDLQCTYKLDNTPVSMADRAVEDFLFGEIGLRYPQDSILGEETGEKNLRSDKAQKYRWIVDPIDGTASFLKGMPFFPY